MTKETKDLAVKEESNLLVKTSNKFLNLLQEKAMDVMKSYFQDDRKIRKFIGAAQIQLKKSKALAECTNDSLFDAFITCIETGLYPGSGCHLIPYKGKATFQLDYRGCITLACRSSVADIDAFIIYEKDRDNFIYRPGEEDAVQFTPDPFSEERGEPIGAYVVSRLKDGHKKYRVFSKNDILKHREFSQSWRKDQKDKTKYSPWQPQNDPQLTMWLKTAIKQAVRFLPLDAEEINDLQRAYEADYAGNVERGEVVDMKQELIEHATAEPSEYASFDEVSTAIKSAEKSLKKDMLDDIIKQCFGDKPNFNKITLDQLTFFNDTVNEAI